MTKIARALVLLALVGATGCAQNAILELQLDLPPAPADSQDWFAQVQMRPAVGNGFDVAWMGSEIQTVQLGTDRQWDCISVQSTDDSVDLNVRVRFCHASDCYGFGDDTAPERRFALEHPFYIGRHTYWSTRIEAVPECVTDADCDVGVCVGNQCGCSTSTDCTPRSADPESYRCEAGGCVLEAARCKIAGCVEGGRTAFFCTADGAHFCENGGYDRTEAYVCSLAPPPGRDSGVDAGTDAGADAGADAGTDAGADAGF